METAAAIASRRVCRSFQPGELPRRAVVELLDLARRAPSAGFSQGIEFLVLDRPETRRRYWDVTLPADRRATFPWPGLLNASVLVVLLVRPGAWIERYAEPDKARRGLGVGPEAWGVPFWWFDAGAVSQNLLLLAEDRGLGALIFGLFDHEESVLAEFGIADDMRAAAVIALVTPDGERAPSASVTRHPRASISESVHYGQEK